MRDARTPLRYPGGKQRLTPFIREILAANEMVDAEYAEPYAGGAGVAFELLFDRTVRRIHLNDASRPVYAFWHSVLNHADTLCQRITDAPLTVEEWRVRREVFRNPDDYDDLELGFSVFYLNRCNRSGILGGGVIGGYDQQGGWKMDARFPKTSLVRRIEAIALRAASITLHNWDAERFIHEHVPTMPLNSLVYCDPPYFEKGSSLYLNHYRADDHHRIARVVQRDLPRPWVVSYDSAPKIREYYRHRESFEYDLQYSASRVYKGKEIFVFSDDLAVPTRSALPYIHVGINGPPQLELAGFQI